MNRLKITLSSGILSLIAILIVALSSFTIIYFYTTNVAAVYTITKERIVDTQQNIVSEISSNINTIQMQVAMLAKLSSDYNIMDAKQIQSQVMWSQLLSNENIDSIFIADEHKNFLQARRYPDLTIREIANYNGDRMEYWDIKNKDYTTKKIELYKAQYDPTSREWYKIAQKEDTFYQSEPYTYATSKQRGITISYAIIDGNDKIKVAAADFTSKKISTMLQKYAKSLQGDLILYNSKGNIISSSFANNQLEKISQLDFAPQIMKLFPKVIDEKIFDGEVVHNDEEYIYFTQSFKAELHNDWYITTCIKKSVIFEKIYTAVLKVVAISFGVVIAMFLLISYLFKKVVIQPVAELNQLSNWISNREYDKIKHINTKFSEFDDLSHSMLVMSQSIENYQNNLGALVDEKTHELEESKKDVEQILSNILLPILITSKSKRTILYANKYAEQQYEMTLEEIIGSEIDNVYTLLGQKDDILNAIKRDGYVANMEQKFKTNSGRVFDALLSVTPIVYKDEPAFIGMVTDITQQKEMEKEIRQIHKHTRDSIEYAALIQTALIPDNNLFRKYFSDYFVIWHPKDVVGGDIYLLEELRHDDECLLMVIDCTGHGVPGAFVTMLVKAIERQIVSKINFDPNEIVSPAKLLTIFNKSMKHLLKQEDKISISNAGFDGQIVYFNRKEKVLKCASAKNTIFYLQDDEIKELKGDRQSVGYNDCDGDFEFTEHIIDISKDTTVYLSTDGYWDQMGGENERSFGKKRFKALMETLKEEPLAEQQEEFIYTLHDYQGKMDRQDDITMVAFKIKGENNV